MFVFDVFIKSEMCVCVDLQYRTQPTIDKDIKRSSAFYNYFFQRLYLVLCSFASILSIYYIQIFVNV